MTWFRIEYHFHLQCRNFVFKDERNVFALKCCQHLTSSFLSRTRGRIEVVPTIDWILVPYRFFSDALLNWVCHIRKSNGWGNLFSNVCHRVSAKGSSIVTRLVSLSLTECGLQIQVHQHFGYKLHLFWRGTGNDVSSEGFMERVFLMYGDVDRFCTEVKKGALEGLCTCVSEGVVHFLKVKAELCSRTNSLPSESVRFMPRSWMKTC